MGEITTGEVTAEARVRTLLAAHKALDATLETVPVADIDLTLDRENVEMIMEVKGERKGVLSPRATKNLSKLTRASVPLLFNQTDPTLNALFKRQLAEMNGVVILRDPSDFDSIVSVFPANVYQPYETLLGDLAEDVVDFSGDLLENDALTFVFKGVEVPGMGLLTGLRLTLSANTMTRSSVCTSMKRVVNGTNAIDRVSMNSPIKEVSSVVVSALSREFGAKSAEHLAEVESTLAFARATPLNQSMHWHLLDGFKLNKKVVDRYKSAVQYPGEYGEVLDAASVGGVTTLWDSFCLLISLARDVELPAARAKVETAAYSWLADIRALAV